MCNTLCRLVYELEGLSLSENAILFHLAFAVPKDGKIANMALATLAHRACCSIRTVQYGLRQLEKLGYLTPIGEKGRGHILKYIVTPVDKKNVEETPVESSPVAPPEEIPPTNGHKPPKLPDRKNGLSAYRDPLARRPDETAMEYARRVDRR